MPFHADTSRKDILRQRSRDHVESLSGDLFLERIPESIYEDLVDNLRRRYGFRNGIPDGGRLRCSEYFLGLRRSAADGLLQCVQDMLRKAQAREYPVLPPPDGFRAPPENLSVFDQAGGIPFGYFDAAVTSEGLRIIEVQSQVTYVITSAFAGGHLRRSLALPGSSVFVHDPEADWQDLIDLHREIVAGPETQGIVIADRDLRQQKTVFEHVANQRELGLDMDVVDTRWIFEDDGRLWYRADPSDSRPKRVRRLYHRTLALEAMEEDDYPHCLDRWKFRFDRPYSDLVHINHPGTNFILSKHILPYVSHPLNPPCYELSEVADALRRGDIAAENFVWKHKLGVAGRGLFLLPGQNLLDRLTEEDQLGEYIAQSRVDFERFQTGDGLEKIVELRFMSVQSEDRLLLVPMARIGHMKTHPGGRQTCHIHFGENNSPGLGFCPVLIVD